MHLQGTAEDMEVVWAADTACAAAVPCPQGRAAAPAVLWAHSAAQRAKHKEPEQWATTGVSDESALDVCATCPASPSAGPACWSQCLTCYEIPGHVPGMLKPAQTNSFHTQAGPRCCSAGSSSQLRSGAGVTSENTTNNVTGSNLLLAREQTTQGCLFPKPAKIAPGS